MYGDLRLILLLLVFLGLFASLCFYFYFYRKYSRELSKSFHLLSDKQYLDVNDYLFYEQLGLPGFAHRVFLMKRILAGKATKQNRKKKSSSGGRGISIIDIRFLMDKNVLQDDTFCCLFNASIVLIDCYRTLKACHLYAW